MAFENSLIDECKKDRAYRSAILKEMKELQKIFDEGAQVCFDQSE
jgi:hypothetical protein